MEKNKKIKYLIDIGHPAHVHYFKNFAKIEIDKGNEVLFTCRDKDTTISLLKQNNFTYFNLGSPYKSSIGKVLGLFYFTFRLFLIFLKKNPNIFLNASMYAAIVACLFRKIHISLEDTYNMEQVKIYSPFTNCILTGDYEHPDMGSKQIEYSGYQELLYLHPHRFKPDLSVLQELGVSPQEKYVIVRFVSWNASHDIGHKGISHENKLKAIKAFSNHAKVFISSETELPKELKPYQYPLNPITMHHAMAYASLIFGESATMASEAAMLGVPSIYLDNTGRFYTDDLENNYDLCFNYTESLQDQEKAIVKGIELLQRDKTDLQLEWQQKRNKMLEDKIDVTAFLVWFVENYPQSKEIMKENPDYQYNFK